MLHEHEVVVAQFRALADTRFKLIGLLPLGSVGALLYLGKETSIVGPVGLFGAVVTFALYIYHLRNDQLYNELVSRAGQIERELGLFEGSFLQRPSPWVALGAGLQVEHGWPIKLIYAATVGLWLSFSMSAIQESFLPPPAPPEAATVRFDAAVDAKGSTAPCISGECGSVQLTVQPSAKAKTSSSSPWLSIGMAAVVVTALFWWLSAAQERSSARLRRAVREAMKLLSAVPTGAELPSSSLADVAFALRRGLGKSRSTEERFLKRLEFYLSPDHRRDYVGDSRRGATLGDQAAARVLAQVIDQPARWIFDIHTGRRG